MVSCKIFSVEFFDNWKNMGWAVEKMFIECWWVMGKRGVKVMGKRLMASVCEKTLELKFGNETLEKVL